MKKIIHFFLAFFLLFFAASCNNSDDVEGLKDYEAQLIGTWIEDGCDITTGYEVFQLTINSDHTYTQSDYSQGVKKHSHNGTWTATQYQIAFESTDSDGTKFINLCTYMNKNGKLYIEDKVDGIIYSK